jgi:tRNA(Arg) A34 adenosine deaminase TadA
MPLDGVPVKEDGNRGLREPERVAILDVHRFFMRLALDEALKAAEMGEVPVGAVLADGEGQLLASAHNRPIERCDPTAHAEILVLREGALRLSNYRLPGAFLYVTLEPCAMCVGAMLHARVGTLVFGAPDPKSGAAGSVVDLTKVPSFNHYIQVVGGVESEACAQVIREFFRLRRPKRAER